MKMTQNTAIIISLVITLVEILGFVIYAILKSEWWANLYSNKIKDAWIYVDLETHYKPIKGFMLFHHDSTTYWYRFEGVYKEVTVPSDYPIKYVTRRRLIYADYNLSVALAFPTTHGKKDESIHKFSEEQLSSHHLVWSSVELVKTIKQQGLQITMAMIIIGAVVILAIGGGLWYYKSHQKPAAANNPVTISTTSSPLR